MPTELKGFITDLHVHFAYCEGELSIKNEKDVTYGNEVYKVPDYLKIGFMTDNEDLINNIRKHDGQISLRGYFVNDGSNLIFEVKEVA